MSTCEKCWADAGGDPETYKVLLEERLERPCTAEQQAGPGATLCPICGRMTRHQHTGECMACGGYEP